MIRASQMKSEAKNHPAQSLFGLELIFPPNSHQKDQPSGIRRQDRRANRADEAEESASGEGLVCLLLSSSSSLQRTM